MTNNIDNTAEIKKLFENMSEENNGNSIFEGFKEIAIATFFLLWMMLVMTTLFIITK